MIAFNLEKSTEVLQLSLIKKQVDEIKPCQVHLEFDVSGSFDYEHRDGHTQKLLNRFVPFAMLFDKDKTLDGYVFASKAEKLEDINEQNYSNYVRDSIMKSSIYNGGTQYCPIFKLMIDESGLQGVETETKVVAKSGFFSKLLNLKTKVECIVPTGEKEKHLHFFITDGEAFDQGKSRRLLENTIKDNVFIVFISIYDEKIGFLESSFGDKEYSSYLNFTHSELHNLENMSDEAMYDMLLNKNLVSWMNKTC